MANEAEESPNTNPNPALINSFCEITSSSQQEALFYLESHNYDLDAAVLTFFDSNQSSNLLPNPSANPNPTTNPNLNPNSPGSPSQSESLSQSQSYSPSRSNSRSRSVSPPTRQSRAPYELRSRRPEGKKPDKGSGSGSRTRGIRTLADLNRSASDDSGSDSDEPQEYYTGGEKSGMLVRDPSKGDDVESIFNQAKRTGAVERTPDKAPSSSKSKSFTGKARLLSGEAVSADPQPPETVSHTITFWQNGFTVDDGPLRRLDDPQNASFLESIKNSSCPEELEPADRRTSVHIDLVRRDEAYTEPKKPQVAFKGTGRTLGSTSSAAASVPAAAASDASSLTSQPAPFMGLVVDDSLPTTSIQLRLADGTRMVSHFNYSHTIRDIRGFIDASRPGGARNYLLQTMGFPPRQLSDADQTIEQAGIANSVVIQKF